MIIIIALALVVLYLFVNIGAVFVRNHKAHKFFQTHSPKLPLVPNANIFTGNLLEVLAPWKNWKIIDDLHRKYGPTFGYYIAEQPWVSTKDMDLIKRVLADDAYKHLDRTYLGFPFEEINNSIVQVNGDKWRQVRRIFTPALTNHKVRSDEVQSDIESIVDQLAASMERKSKRALEANGGGSKSAAFVTEATDLCERYTLAVIFLITYKQADLIDFDAPQDEWVRAIDLGARAVPNPLIHASMMFPFTRPLCNYIAHFHGFGSLLLKIVDYIEEATDVNRMARKQHSHLQKRLSLSTGQKERDFSEVKSQGLFKRRMVDTIIDAFLDKKIKYKNFVGSLLFMLLAGFKTTSDTICGLLWQLAKNPDIQEKLRKTILEEGIDADYVIWVINESIRRAPAVPLGAGRVLGEDVEVNGQFLPKGTFVMTSTYSIHHDPSVWPEPERFNPERWRDQANFHPAQFVGFGLGPRNCVGGKLAVHEIKLVLKMILSKYRVENCDETPDEWIWSSPGMAYALHDEPVMIRFRPLREIPSNGSSGFT